MLAAGEEYAGRSQQDWAIEYMRWFYSQTKDDCETALTDRDGSHCAAYQEDSESPVFFFERTEYSNGTAALEQRTECEVPAGKALLVPLALVSIDNAGVDEPSSDAELEAQAAEIMASMRELILTADGVAFDDLSSREVGPVAFHYEVPPAPNYYSCRDVEGVADITITPSYLSGYLAMLEPPEPGEYELEYGSTLTYLHNNYEFHLKTRFTVVE